MAGDAQLKQTDQISQLSARVAECAGQWPWLPNLPPASSEIRCEALQPQRRREGVPMCQQLQRILDSFCAVFAL